VEEPPPPRPTRLLVELIPPILLRSRFGPFLLLVKFPKEVLDRLRVILLFWDFAAPAVRLRRRAGMLSDEACLEMIPADL